MSIFKILAEKYSWTPKQVEDLTVDQLCMYLKTEESKSKNNEIEPIKVEKKYVEAWVKAGCPPTLESFIKNLNKRGKK